MFDFQKSKLQCYKLDELESRSIEFFIKRDDLIDEFISGNKGRKLNLNLESAIHQKKSGILTFGGAYSNHLLATAAACQQVGMKSVGIVRGEELSKYSNHMLEQCSHFGMELKFVSRDQYALRHEKYYQESLLIEFPNFMLIPEGGANYLGIIGCQQIMREINRDFDHVFVAQGTTCTSVGIALSLPVKTTLHTVPVLKGFDAMNEMKNLMNSVGFEEQTIHNSLKNVLVHPESHVGGYGKVDTELLYFIEYFYAQTSVPLDPIYTGKVIYAMMNWIQVNNIENTSILFIHTGGLQGGKEMSKDYKIKFA